MKASRLGRIGGIVALLLPTWGPASPQAGKQLAFRPRTDTAVLTGARGTVEVKRARVARWARVDYTTLLAPGDTVRAAGDGSATLLLASGEVRPVSAGATPFPVPRAAKAAPIFARLREALRNALDGGGIPVDRGPGYLTRFIGLNPEPPLPVVALSPHSHSKGKDERLEHVLDPRPAFRCWTAAGVADLTLGLWDGALKKTFWSAPVAPVAGEIPYPAGQEPLGPGEYVWILNGKLNGKDANDDGKFLVPTPERARAIRANLEAASRQAAEGTPNMALVGACLQHRVYVEAEKELRAAWQRSPSDGTLRCLLAYLYRGLRDRTPPEELRPKEK